MFALREQTQQVKTLAHCCSGGMQGWRQTCKRKGRARAGNEWWAARMAGRGQSRGEPHPGTPFKSQRGFDLRLYRTYFCR